VEDPQFTPGSGGNADNDDYTALQTGAWYSCFGDLVDAFRGLQKPMLMLMLVTAINWLAWFPYTLYDTDWMGREVYGGEVGTSAYDAGVHAGSLGLMLNSVVLALMSLGVEPMGRLIGVKWLWAIVNVILAVSMAMTVVITKAARHERNHEGVVTGHPSMAVKAGAMSFFSVLGIPLAV